MSFFAPVERSFALLRKGGMFSESPIYTYGNVLYARLGAKYVRLKKSGMTSVPKLLWDEIDIDPTEGTLDFDDFNATLKTVSRKRVSAVR